MASSCNPLLFRTNNCRGLRDNKTRYDYFNWLKSRPIGIDFLQETHCHLRKEAIKWGREWSSQQEDSYWSLGTNRSKGVAILFHPRLREIGISISHVLLDSNGRYIKLILKIRNCTFRVLNVYAPNNERDRVNFFLSLHDILQDDIQEAENINGGDWNCVMDSEIDRLNCLTSQDVGQIDLKYLSEIYDMEDIWRRRNPNKREYTWQGRGKMSRIDMFLTSKSLNGQVQQISHSYAPYTDHSSVILSIRVDDVKRGKGLWKMNTAHILEEEYKEGITNLWREWQSKKHEFADNKRWWDIGKNRIKNFTIGFSNEMTYRNKSNLHDLEYEINLLKQTDPNNSELNVLQKQYDETQSKISEGARIRARIKWWEQGEKSTKYFFGLEKKNGKEKSWDKILDEQGNSVSGNSNIQARQVRFYKELYTSQTSTNQGDNNLLEQDMQFFHDPIDKQLSNESKQMLEADINKDEVAKALKKMPNNKSPGQDGIPIEFYKIYWHLLGDDLLDVFKAGLEDKCLSYTQYLAVIILLYKKGDRADIRNWRPISLLNLDYKILSKVFAERLKLVLHEIISNEQKGCIPGRFIGDNIRHIDDLLFEIENQSENSIILMLDQEKAFDRVEWHWLFSTLEKFNFGPNFISHLKTLYKNAKSCVMTNGFQSAYFNITRGIRQGDSLSALLYIIQFEPLVQKLRNDNRIKGVDIELKHCNNEVLNCTGCQYVDDSNTMLKNYDYIDRFLEITDRFENVSGSKTNVDKTVALTVKQELSRKIKGIKITTGPEKVLGIAMGKSSDNFAEFWESKLQKLKGKLDIWRQRDLSFEGKALLIKSLAVSQILYAIEMKCVDKKIIQRAEKIIFDFLWSGKRSSVNRNICYLPRDKGGLGIPNLQTLVKVKRIRWIIRLLKEDSEQDWSKLMENYLRCLDNKFNIFLFSLKVTDSSELLKDISIPDFYKECIQYFQEMLRNGKFNNKYGIIWCNANYKFRNQVLSIPHWSRSGIKVVSDLYSSNHLNPQSLRNKITHKAGFQFEFSKVRRVFPGQLINDNENAYTFANGDKKNILEQTIEVPDVGEKKIGDLTSKDIYLVMQTYNPHIITSTNYWENKFNIYDMNWDEFYDLNLTNNFLPRKCKDFNFKLFHGKVNTGVRLKIMNLSSDICSVCNNNIEDAEHLIYRCENSKQIWLVIKDILSISLEENIQVDIQKSFIGIRQDATHNYDNKTLKLINVILSITRFHIWKVRCSIKYGKEQVPLQKSKRQLKYSLSSHLFLLKRSSDTTIKKLSDAITLVVERLL